MFLRSDHMVEKNQRDKSEGKVDIDDRLAKNQGCGAGFEPEPVPGPSEPILPGTGAGVGAVKNILLGAGAGAEKIWAAPAPEEM